MDDQQDHADQTNPIMTKSFEELWDRAQAGGLAEQAELEHRQKEYLRLQEELFQATKEYLKCYKEWLSYKKNYPISDIH